MTVERLRILLNMFPEEDLHHPVNIVLVNREGNKKPLRVDSASITGETDDDTEVTIYVSKVD